MNKLSLQKRVQIINLLVEGNGINGTSRLMDVSKNTVLRLLRIVGSGCYAYHHKNVINLECKRIQCDEIWSFVAMKEKNVPEEHKGKEGYGDAYTWTAIDPDTKLIVSYYVGKRDMWSGIFFMRDLAKRLSSKVQLTSDGFKAYEFAVSTSFNDGVDFAQVIKQYEANRYVGCTKTVISGSPDQKYISTVFVERQNLTIRMHTRRFGRKTNAFSKKIENHKNAISLFFMYYNFCKIHLTLRVTPAMESGLTDHVWSIEELILVAQLEEKFLNNSN